MPDHPHFARFLETALRDPQVAKAYRRRQRQRRRRALWRKLVRRA